jgi:hypothetical protein
MQNPAILDTHKNMFCYKLADVATVKVITAE